MKNERHNSPLTLQQLTGCSVFHFSFFTFHLSPHFSFFICIPFFPKGKAISQFTTLNQLFLSFWDMIIYSTESGGMRIFCANFAD